MKTKGRRIAITTGLVSLVILALAVYLGWPHLVFWYRFAPMGVNAQGYPEYRHRQTGIVFVRLPGGTFSMGGQKEDPGKPNYDPDVQDDEGPGPIHEVVLSPFLIGKHEVTQSQWLKVMGSNPSHFMGDENRPVEQVYWNDIQKFEAKTGLTLPTEAEWEYACRAGTRTPFAGQLEDLGWYSKNSGNTTHPVGTKASNGFGLHDMHGNVCEWCEDVYDEGFYGKPDAAGPDPVSTTGSVSRVFRGGSRSLGARYCRSASRGRLDPSLDHDDIGFRAAWRWPR